MSTLGALLWGGAKGGGWGTGGEALVFAVVVVVAERSNSQELE